MNRWEDDDYRAGNAVGLVLVAVIAWAFGLLCGMAFL